MNCEIAEFNIGVNFAHEGKMPIISCPSIDSLLLPSPNSVPIIYPDINPCGRLWIPLQYFLPTNGLDRYLQHQPHAPSLCLLFQKGRCNSGNCCNQLHVDRGFTAAVKSTLQTRAAFNCCETHGDLRSICASVLTYTKAESLHLRQEGLPPIPIPGPRMAITLFWSRFASQHRRALYFTPDRVCKLHQQNACKYGAECKNVHVCREMWSDILCGNYNPENFQDSAPDSPLDALKENNSNCALTYPSTNGINHNVTVPPTPIPVVSVPQTLAPTLAQVPTIRPAPPQLTLQLPQQPSSPTSPVTPLSNTSPTSNNSLRKPNRALAIVDPNSPQGAVDVEWLNKTEASRGKFKNLSGLSPLGILVPRGPGDTVPFAFGRGRRIVEQDQRSGV